jgi:uroporphyrinogen decarboxylase
MTSRERVEAAFEHQEPDCVPRWCGASPEFWAKAKQQLQIADDETLRRRFGDDFRRVWARYAGPRQFSPSEDLPAGMVCRTPFGVLRRGIGFGQPVSHPLAEATLQQVHNYQWPDAQWMDVSAIRDEALAWDRQYAILGGDWSPYWHDAIDLLGMENLILKMYDEPRLVDAVMRHVVDYYAAVSQRIFDAAADVIDIFFIGNDFGGRTGPLLSPAQFQRFMMPHLKRLINLGHEYRLRVMLHCCGGVGPLLPAMIAAGLDGVHAIQPCCRGMDLRRLKATYGRKILFNGAIDSHHVLIRGTPRTVRDRTYEVLAIMAPGGGYVAGASHDYILEETPVENVVAMFDAVEEFRLS